MPIEPSGVGPGGNIPGVCWICGQMATGIGCGTRVWGKGDAQWLCEECVPMLEKVKGLSKKRLEIAELEALQGGIDAVGVYLDEKGMTDLALMDELDARLIVKAAWQGTVKRLRQIIERMEE